MTDYHTRCARCRNETGEMRAQPILCHACMVDVVPWDMWNDAQSRGYALGYAAALFAQRFGELAEPCGHYRVMPSSAAGTTRCLDCGVEV